MFLLVIPLIFQQNGILWNTLEMGERMPNSDHAESILTIREVAALLRVVDKTVYTMAQRSEMPAFKVRGQWRFKRDDIEHWIEGRKADAVRQCEPSNAIDQDDQSIPK